MAPIQTVSSGYTIVSGGNTVENATVLSGGVLILRGGRALNTKVSGGYVWMSAGEAVDTLLLGESTYVGCISSGAVTSRTSAYGNKSYETVRSGGTSLDGKFYTGAYQLLSEGGLATGTILAGGSVIQRGGRLLNAEVDSGYIWMSAGEAVDTLLLGESTYVGCISSGAVTSRTSAYGNKSYETVRSGGTSLDGEFHSGTYQVIRDGGIVSNVTILDGANQYISSGAIIKGDIELWGNMYGRETALASEATAHLHQGGGRIYNYDNLAGLSITFDADLSTSGGYYLLASGCSDFTGTFTVRDEDGLTAFTMQLDQEVSYNGRSYILRNPGTNLVLLVSDPLSFGFGTYSEIAWYGGQRALITHFAGLDKNSFILRNGVYSYYNESVIDAEKVDATDLDDRGCGEAAGTNMLFMTGWAQLAGYESEDQLYKEFYQIDGTADYGSYHVIRHVFNQLPGYSMGDYYNYLTVDAALFNNVEARLRDHQAVRVMYNHGTPDSYDGDHVITVWGLIFDESYSEDDPRHYAAMIVSDSDDDKHGYPEAEDAPNRLKTMDLTWNPSEMVYYCDDGYIANAAALRLAPSAELHTFGNTEYSLFSISETTNGFLVGVSGLTYQDFSPSSSYSFGYDEYVNEKIIDAEKYAATDVDDYWCQVLTNVNQLVYGGWAQKAGYPDEDTLALELLDDPSILDEYSTSWEYVFSKLPQYRLDDYTHMFRMVGNDGVSLNNVNAMAEVDAYMRASKSSVYLQLDWGDYGAKTGSHAITMYGFTYDLSYSPDDPRYYTGVIVSDSDNNKKGEFSGNLAPNSFAIIPIEWDAQNKVYSIFSHRPGVIRYFWGLDNAPEGESPIDTAAPAKPTATADITSATNQDVTVSATFSNDSAQKQYSRDGKNWLAYTTGIVMSTNGTVYFRGIDAAGNISDVTSYAVSNIDKVAPVITLVGDTQSAVYETSLTATVDDGGKLYYCIGNSAWLEYTAPITVSANAIYSFKAADAAGNIGTASVEFSNILSKAPTNLVGSKDALSWGTTGASRYVVEYSTDNFEHSIQLTTTQTGLDSLDLPAETYLWRVRSEDNDQWTQGESIISDNTSTVPKVISSTANGNGDVFFATANGTWTSGYAAKHVGSIGDWDGTNELVSTTGKNRLYNLFFGSTDSNILLLTDDANGDAIFVDDIYTELPGTVSQQQSRIARIQEIRAGVGDDIVDMTSQRFEYIGDGLTIRGGAGNDTLWANKGDNILFGDAGNDRLVGASGNDVLAGGIGNDRMHGGGGNDIFAFCDNWGVDTVEQLADGDVTLWFESGSLDNWDASTLTYTDGTSSVKVSGVTADKVSRKFGDDGSEQYASLAVNGAFADFSSEKIFEDKNKGILATI